jgi:spore maturation protein CgeB
MVVAEPCYRPDPFVPGVHYAEAPIKELPDLIRYYLAHDEERERIVAAGHRLVTEELTFARSADMVVGIIRQHLAGREWEGARPVGASARD